MVYYNHYKNLHYCLIAILAFPTEMGQFKVLEETVVNNLNSTSEEDIDQITKEMEDEISRIVGKSILEDGSERTCRLVKNMY